MLELTLDAFECRVLGVLAEKQFFTPDTYPLSLNAIVQGANQLSNREPVMALSEGGVEAAIKHLQERKLSRTYYPAGSRVAKYEHMLREVFELDDQKLSVLTVLLLRGPQTAGEIRTRTNRMYPFASGESVERTLNELATLGQPLAVQLPRAPGTKEPRWAHLLSGAEAIEREMSRMGSPIEVEHHSDNAALEARVAELELEIAALRNEFDALKRQLGA